MANEQATQKTENAIDGVGTQIEQALEDISKGDLSGIFLVIQDYVLPVAMAFLFLIIGYFVAKFLAKLASTPVRTRVDETVGRFISQLVFYSIMTFVLLGILGRFGISVASFAAVLAAAGFAIGLAFQGTLSNFAAGILLLVFRPFKVGDVINSAGVTGKVDEIDLFTTTINTPDNRRIIVPNSSISGSTIENITYHSERRVDIKVGVDYTAKISTTRETLNQAAEQLQEYLVEGPDRGYQVFLSDLGDSSVNWVVRFWTKSENYWTVWQELTESVKNSLDHAQIGIPFPQMDIHVVDLPSEKKLLRAANNS